MQTIMEPTKYLAALMLLVCSLLFASFSQAAGDGAEKVTEPRPLGLDLMVIPIEETGKAKNTTNANAGVQQRNPFAVTDKLTRQIERPATPTSSGPVFTPQEQSGAIPKMRLRGHLQGADGEVVALLEIEGGDVHIVREGDTVGLHGFGFDSVIRVKKINRLHVVIESGSLGQLIIVH
jgi:hypothetical protein